MVTLYFRERIAPNDYSIICDIICGIICGIRKSITVEGMVNTAEMKKQRKQLMWKEWLM